MAKAQAAELRRIVDKTFADAETLFGRMALIKMQGGEIHRFLELLFPRTAQQKARGENPARWSRIEAILDDAKVTPAKTRHTLWALYNAIVRDEDYRSSREAGPEARLERVWFGSGHDLKIKALQTASQYAKAA